MLLWIKGRKAAAWLNELKTIMTRRQWNKEKYSSVVELVYKLTDLKHRHWDFEGSSIARSQMVAGLVTNIEEDLCILLHVYWLFVMKIGH